MKEAWRSDPATHPRLLRGTARPIWQQSWVSCGTDARPRPCSNHPRSHCVPWPLDLSASEAHSYGRPSDPPWNTEASQPQLPRIGSDGQPPERPHLERDGSSLALPLLPFLPLLLPEFP